MTPIVERRVEFVPSVVKGELAKLMAREIARPATKAEIAGLRNAMKNRVPRRDRKR